MHPPERTMIFQMPAISQGRLVGLEGSVKGRVFPLSTGTFVIGRVETTDLPLKDPGVSREHAKIGFDGDAYTLADLESRNGTFLNGKPVRSARLSEGDVVRICGVALRFTFLDVQPQPQLPPEFSLEDPTDEVQNAPRQPQARVATVSMIAPQPPPNRALKIIVGSAVATALAAAGVVVAVVITMRREPAPKVAVAKPVPADTPVAAVKTEPVKPVVTPPVDAPVAASVDAGVAAPVAAPVDAPVDAPVEVASTTKSDNGKSKRTKRDRPKKDAGKSEWLAARSGPEPVFAPVEGIVTSTVPASAVAGEELIVINDVSVKAPATGKVRGAARLGDRVRKGQLVGRIQEDRLRADVPSSLAGRAKRGAKVELQQADGSVTTATIVDVTAGTIFIDAQDDVSWVRFR